MFNLAAAAGSSEPQSSAHSVRVQKSSKTSTNTKISCHHSAGQSHAHAMSDTWWGALDHQLFLPLPLSILLIEVSLGFICSKNLMPELGGLFSRFLTSCSWKLSLNSLHLHSWRRLFVVRPPSPEYFFFTKEIILPSSTLVLFFRILRGLLMMLSSPVHCFIIRRELLIIYITKFNPFLFRGAGCDCTALHIRLCSALPAHPGERQHRGNDPHRGRTRPCCRVHRWVT